MDRLTDQTQRAIIASTERAAIKPPESLTGDALAMFLTIAEGNKARPWNAAHSHALADYCRVTVMWEEQMRELEREGPIVAGKPNGRFKVMPLLSAERLRMGKLLGLHVGANDRYLVGGGRNEDNARKLGAAIVESSELPGGSLLA